MFNKSFISVYFSEKQILIAQLNPGRKSVKKYAAASLPDGLIKNYKVTNPKLLAEILSQIWSKLKLHQKSVSIVIPEYAAFIKIFTLSNIGVSEIHEAIKWQLTEVLPYTPEEAITDWKILKRVEKEYIVLSVSIEKSTLETYLKSFETAGLFPVIVEIPSATLTRVLKNDESIVFIHIGEMETMILLLFAGRLAGSSMVNGKSEEEIIQTTGRILAHYKDVKPTKIVISGEGLSGDRLTQKFNLPVENLKMSWGNLPPADTAKFLIPISSQIQDPSVPTDPFSLNLVPNELIKKYKSAKMRLQVWSMTLAITLFVSITFLSTLASFFYLNLASNELSVKADSLSANSSGSMEYSRQAKEINNLSKKVLDIKAKTFSSTQILNLINSAKPDGVTINSFKVDLEQGTVAIVGLSTDRQQLVTFRDNLEKVDTFDSPEIPISSYEKEKDLDFEIFVKYTAAVPAKKEVKNVK
ncbi:MAG: Type IV pilus assembly protein PilM [Microgenomates group bacterium GW2011_GWC1_37_12b]|uniref:Type IV pilus assembly protein PilM n=1 Tax=Candidatus Woesebacteria bacterium GW2011_GWB1_38_8b TaxID=1618571 RepID=A0A0G0NMY2_9BACT|nr:MAG: Type IV pilus assembly protein PilM [Microgenomates group bacterium GW2011_GWC1_37_12b]KKQ87249.1 MAG: Type IV pilus assembly protein PilM [Candidatus Woesebacteria bacterium GW2011_GWB1_38_8b]